MILNYKKWHFLYHRQNSYSESTSWFTSYSLSWYTKELKPILNFDNYVEIE